MSYHMRKGNNGRTIYIYENFNVEKDGETGHIAGYIVSYPSQVADPNPPSFPNVALRALLHPKPRSSLAWP